ncbi:MAG: hypothetical protein GVY10_01955, partial [Verrucomicrobia bacterium]|nr:hypothetical protein [Verrucomicrobiota bacterium]
MKKPLLLTTLAGFFAASAGFGAIVDQTLANGVSTSTTISLANGGGDVDSGWVLSTSYPNAYN